MARLMARCVLPLALTLALKSGLEEPRWRSGGPRLTFTPLTHSSGSEQLTRHSGRSVCLCTPAEGKATQRVSALPRMRRLATYTYMYSLSVHELCVNGTKIINVYVHDSECKLCMECKLTARRIKEVCLYLRYSILCAYERQIVPHRPTHSRKPPATHTGQ